MHRLQLWFARLQVELDELYRFHTHFGDKGGGSDRKVVRVKSVELIQFYLESLRAEFESATSESGQEILKFLLFLTVFGTFFFGGGGLIEKLCVCEINRARPVLLGVGQTRVGVGA
jgi:hypothetical protein